MNNKKIPGKVNIDLKRRVKKMKDCSASGLVPGLLLGAALGMAGAYCLCHSPRQLKRTTRRLTRSAENALCELEDLIARYRD